MNAKNIFAVLGIVCAVVSFTTWGDKALAAGVVFIGISALLCPPQQ